MDNPNKNPLWDTLFGSDSISGSARTIVFIAAFAVVGGIIFQILI